MSSSIRIVCGVSACLVMTLLSACGGGGGGGGGGPSASIAPAAPAAPQAQGNSYVVSVADLTNVQVSGQSAKTGSTVTATSPVAGGFLPVYDDNEVSTGNTKQTFTTTVSVSGGNVAPMHSGTLSNCETDHCHDPAPFKRDIVTQIDPTHSSEKIEALVLSSYAQTSSGPGSANTPLQSSFYGAYLQANFTQESTRDPVTGTVSSDDVAGNVDYALLHGGDATSAQQMASLKSSNVTAQYYGHFMGMSVTQGENALAPGSKGLSDVEGDVGMTANFGSGAVTGNVYNMKAEDAADNLVPTTYGLRMDGTINGSTYSGTTAYTAAATAQGAAAVGATRGDVIGGFYGTNAAETTGVARISGAPPGVAGTETLVGAFGAKKQ